MRHPPKSLPQRPKGAVQGVRSHALGRKVDFGENACVFAERRMRSFSWKETRKPAIPQGNRPLPTRLRRPTYRGPIGPISLKNVHWTFFRALDAPEPLPSVAGEGFWAGAASATLHRDLQHPDKSEFISPQFYHLDPNNARVYNQFTGMVDNIIRKHMRPRAPLRW